MRITLEGYTYGMLLRLALRRRCEIGKSILELRDIPVLEFGTLVNGLLIRCVICGDA